ncbi:ATP-binding protein [Sphingomicrobium sediminis]|uniref:histidine kinase n=1 Tax=Sphingomicrobium sediminis TaxID=2950949 RepID=A0A9X2EJ86_9SPHN|nr:ATP-binding protein [Sphingomicrobium sediminis]MCM8558517.1 ATP-binding protein [Sphingomicrobium sediminis]
MRLPRLSLATQVALIVGIAIFVAQLINLSLAVENRRGQLITNAVVPGAQRIALVAADPRLVERVAEFGDRRDRRPMARMMERDRRWIRSQVSDIDPVPPSARDFPRGTEILETTLASSGVQARAARAALLPPSNPREEGREGRVQLMLAVQIEDGRWLSIMAPGPQAVGPLIRALIFQSFLIALAVLIPTLLLLNRVGGSLKRLTRSAQRFDGHEAVEPLPETGPRDVATLTGAINAMQSRIAAMMSEKDVMLGAIGHDLRTPLTALRLEAEAVEDDERRDALVAQIEALHGQFEAVLELARASRPIAHHQTVAPTELLERLAAERRKAGQDIELAGMDAAPFPGDPAAIARALDNLIDNALRYGETARLSVVGDEHNVTMSVTDDGPGIAADERDSVREPFRRLEGSRNRGTGGHGLGLAIVSAIMRRHHGELVLADRDDGESGLVASLVFPRRLPQS